MAKTFSQIRSEIQDYLGFTILDDSTQPTISRVNTFINDVIAEIASEFNYKQLETSCRFPFKHVITAQGAYLSGLSTVGSSGISATIIPFPQDNYSQLVNCTAIENYSGISFTGTDSLGNSYAGVSTEGSGVTGQVSVLGYQYELPSIVDQIYSVVIADNSIKLGYVPQYDLDIFLPIGTTISSGTPAYYTEFNGISSNGNKVIQFFPQPNGFYTDKYFTLHYKKKHIPLVNDGDVQTIIPDNFQDIIIYAALEKIYAFLSDEKSKYYQLKKMERMSDLKLWACNSLDYVYVERDGNMLNNTVSAYNNQPLFKI
jgi:hypothetical protein